jgi:hypothetical protein
VKEPDLGEEFKFITFFKKNIICSQREPDTKSLFSESMRFYLSDLF